MELKEVFYDNIYYYTNVFEDAKKIIDTFEELDSVPESYPIIEKWRPDHSERLRKNLYIFDHDWDNFPNGPLKDKMRWLVDTVLGDIEKVSKDFYKRKGIDLEPNYMESLHICKYEDGGGIGFHFDAERNAALLYTLAIYWNDDYEGGELAFQLVDAKRSELESIPNEEKIIFDVKPEAGSVLIFPAGSPYFHSSLKLLSGFKYFTGSAIYVDGFDHMNLEHIKKYTIPETE